MNKNDFETQIKLYAIIREKLTPVETANWEEKFNIEYAHNSTAIEGNTCTLIETKMILEDKIAPAEKTLREIDEIRFHYAAFQYVKENVKQEIPLTEEVIKDIYERVLNVPGIGGIYRNIAVYINGAEHVPPNPKRVREYMKFFMDDLRTNKFADPLEKAAWTHAEFVKIHPFQDGNGRTARLLMNYSLMSDGYPPTIIKKGNVREYFQSLETYSLKGDIQPFTTLLRRNLAKELDQFLHMYQHHIDIKELTHKDPHVLRYAQKIQANELGL